MNERQRQAYLQAMGIQVLYPRLRLDGARPSPGYDFPEPEQNAVAPSGKAGEQSGSGSLDTSRQSLRSRLLDLSDDKQRRTPAEKPVAKAVESDLGASAVAPDTSAVAEVTDAADVLRFRLHYRQIGTQLAVLQEVPWQRAHDSQAESDVLLRNILLALDVSLPEQLPAVESFNWPLSEDMPVAEITSEHAAQALNGFIAMRWQRDGFANLLIFAAQVEDLLFAAGQAEGGADFHLQKPGCHITSVASLQAMLAVPALKKEVWQQLQPLRSRLQSR